MTGKPFTAKTAFLIGLVSALSLLTSCSPSRSLMPESAERSAGQPAPEVSTVPVVKVVAKELNRHVHLTGELVAFRDVSIYPKVDGFIRSITVDRGSVVKAGQLMITIRAPELDAKVRAAQAKLRSAQAACQEARSKVESVAAEQLEAQARFEADDLTSRRLKIAAKVPGAVAGNEVDTAEKVAEAGQARVQSLTHQEKAAKSMEVSEQEKVKAANEELASVEAMREYLTIRAPFDGVITERNVHEGSFVSSSTSAPPLVRIQQRSVLRLVVAVPEVAAAGISSGIPIGFTVPAYLGRRFVGEVQRIGHALDPKTRTMPVELDVLNKSGELEPGMFTDVEWISHRPYKTLFVPSSAVATSLERTFVIRVRDGVAEVVDVVRGQPMGDMVEVVGNLTEGDEVALRAREELQTGARVVAMPASTADIAAASKQSTAGGE